MHKIMVLKNRIDKFKVLITVFSTQFIRYETLNMYTYGVTIHINIHPEFVGKIQINIYHKK